MNALSLIQNLVSGLTGMNTAACGPKALLPAVHKRMKALSITDQTDYYRRLLLARTELDALIEELVVPETWFFRDGAPFELLVRHIRETGAADRPLRLLSVPCCSGEEPYSMAMALLDAGLEAERFHIDALDISPRSIERARLGVYGENAFRNRPLQFRDHHFYRQPEGYRISDAVRRQVSFSQGNLLDPAFLADQLPYDVIFCRNLLIYLEAGAQRRALETLRRLLNKEGLLFVGYAEHGPVQACGFRMLPFPRASAFVDTNRANILPSKVNSTSQTIQHKSLLPTGDWDRNLDPLSPNGERVRVRGINTFALPPAGEGKKQEEKNPIHLSLNDIRRLADQGQTQEALRQCQDYLRDHPPSAEAYYLAGLLLDAHNRPEQAEQSLRRAIYLQPDHRQALAELVGLLRRRGQTQAAAQLLVRARRVEMRSQQLSSHNLSDNSNSRSQPWKVR